MSAIEHSDVKLTIRIQLIRIGNQSAVVFIIRNAVIVVIIVASISFTILVVISLVSIRDVRAVVQVVLVTVLINILVAVTFVSNTVRIRVKLLKRKCRISEVNQNSLAFLIKIFPLEWVLFEKAQTSVLVGPSVQAFTESNLMFLKLGTTTVTFQRLMRKGGVHSFSSVNHGTGVIRRD